MLERGTALLTTTKGPTLGPPYTSVQVGLVIFGPHPLGRHKCDFGRELILLTSLRTTLRNVHVTREASPLACEGVVFKLCLVCAAVAGYMPGLTRTLVLVAAAKETSLAGNIEGK